MPVQFKCTQCKKTLKITRRKIGVEVACPLCGAKLIVPAADEAGAAGEDAHAMPDEAAKAESGGKVEGARPAAPPGGQPASTSPAANIPQPAPQSSSATATEDEEYEEDDEELINEFIVYDGSTPEADKAAEAGVTTAPATPAPAIASSSSNVAAPVVPLRVGSVHVPPGTVLIPRWSLFVTMADGMEELIRALAARLPGGAVRLKEPVTGVAREGAG